MIVRCVRHKKTKELFCSIICSIVVVCVRFFIINNFQAPYVDFAETSEICSWSTVRLDVDNTVGITPIGANGTFKSEDTLIISINLCEQKANR